MKKYKFIGTEQDLIDNGFEISGKLYRHAFRDEGNIFISLSAGGLYDYGVGVLEDNQSGLANPENFKDLIDKGLVVEDE